MQTASSRASRTKNGVMINANPSHSVASVDQVSARSVETDKCSRIHTPSQVTSLSWCKA